jgi:hypothetical protein
MTILKFLPFGIAWMALCGCATAYSSVSGAMSTVEASRGEEGRLVTVRGYLVFGSHARQLWQSKSTFRQSKLSSCLTLVETGRHRETLSRNSNRLVIVTGRVRRDVMTGVVDYGACNKVGIAVKSVHVP